MKKSKPKFFKIRPYNAETDRAYVCDSYMHALRKCDGYDSLPTDVFYASYRERANKAADVFDCAVAYLDEEECGKDNAGYIFGFLQYGWTEQGAIVIGFAYVRDLYRRSGVLGALYDYAVGDFDSRSSVDVLISFGSNALTDSFMRRHDFITRVPDDLFLSESFSKETQDVVITSALRTIERKKLLYASKAKDLV